MEKIDFFRIFIEKMNFLLNYFSKKFQKKIGMQREGTLRHDALLRDGTWRDHFVYGILPRRGVASGAVRSLSSARPETTRGSTPSPWYPPRRYRSPQHEAGSSASRRA